MFYEGVEYLRVDGGVSRISTKNTCILVSGTKGQSIDFAVKGQEFVINYTKLKFETYLKGIAYYKSENKQQTKGQRNKTKRTKEQENMHQPQNKLQKMDNQFNTNVYHFTDEVIGLKSLISLMERRFMDEDMTKEDIMKELFGEFKPGDKVAVQEQEPELAEPPETKKAKKKKKKDQART